MGLLARTSRFPKSANRPKMVGTFFGEIMYSSGCLIKIDASIFGRTVVPVFRSLRTTGKIDATRTYKIASQCPALQKIVTNGL